MKHLVSSIVFLALTAFLFPATAAETCSVAVVHCRARAVRESDNQEKCTAAGEQCMRTGTFIGPYTATVWRGLTKK
jgi:hypothetical protein